MNTVSKSIFTRVICRRVPKEIKPNYSIYDELLLELQDRINKINKETDEINKETAEINKQMEKLYKNNSNNSNNSNKCK